MYFIKLYLLISNIIIAWKHGYLFYGITDINECERNLHGCDVIAKCKNNDGNYTCECPKWYSGDGKKEGGCKNSIVLPTTLGKQVTMPYLFWKITLLTYEIAHSLHRHIFQQQLTVADTFKIGSITF